MLHFLRKPHQLRFDVETISKATDVFGRQGANALRFDVETISKATSKNLPLASAGCGLM